MPLQMDFDSQFQMHFVNIWNNAGYPNPAGNVVNVKNLGKGEVRIFNVVGQEVGVYKIVSNQQALDISNLQAGVYFLQITAGMGVW